MGLRINDTLATAAFVQADRAGVLDRLAANSPANGVAATPLRVPAVAADSELRILESDAIPRPGDGRLAPQDTPGLFDALRFFEPVANLVEAPPVAPEAVPTPTQALAPPSAEQQALASVFAQSAAATQSATIAAGPLGALASAESGVGVNAQASAAASFRAIDEGLRFGQAVIPTVDESGDALDEGPVSERIVRTQRVTSPTRLDQESVAPVQEQLLPVFREIPQPAPPSPVLPQANPAALAVRQQADALAIPPSGRPLLNGATLRISA